MRGGKRDGSGRKKGATAEVTVQRQSRAKDMLGNLGADSTWIWAMGQAKKAKDYKTAVDIMRYWTDRAEGKAPQSVRLDVEDGITFTVGAIAEEIFGNVQTEKSSGGTALSDRKKQTIN